MPSWGNTEFEKAATDIAAAFLASQSQNGASLNALVEKTARDSSLNPEQIRRLCRRSNTIVFENKLAQKNDEYMEFNTADEEAVIRDIVGAESVVGTKTASAAELYPQLRDDFAKPVMTFDKIATERENIERSLDRSLRRPDAEVLYRRTKTAYEQLNSRAGQEDNRWQRLMGKVANASRGTYWDQDRFEADALCDGSTNVMPEVNAIREARGLTPYSVDLQKLAEQLDRIDGRPSAMSRLVKEAAEARIGAERCRQAAKIAAVRLRELERELYAR